MIEMRWIICRAGEGRGLLGGHDGQSYENVLQYRYRYPLATHLPTQYPPEDWVWSEWADVPPPSGG